MEYDKASEMFSENMKAVLERSQYRNLLGVDMVSIIMYHGSIKYII